MPVQKFAPMTKDFPSFDCDAHVTEPPWLWERAKDWLTKDELEALKSSFWFDPESKRLLANGLGYANPASLFHGSAGMVNLLSLAGPGVSHDIQRALNVRNLQRKKPITKEQADYLDHKGSYLPEPRLRDMDIQGIDQVMIIPTDFEAYPWTRMRPARGRCARPTTTGLTNTARPTLIDSTSLPCCRCKMRSLLNGKYIGWRTKAAASV
jgi:hypothetical protein